LRLLFLPSSYGQFVTFSLLKRSYYKAGPVIVLVVVVVVCSSLVSSVAYRYDNICIQLCLYPCCSSFFILSSKRQRSRRRRRPGCPSRPRLEFVPAQRSLGLILAREKCIKNLRRICNLNLTVSQFPVPISLPSLLTPVSCLLCYVSCPASMCACVAVAFIEPRT